jgi:glyoxylase-like metal-dependent hydrolase (beta-lactamase superfamily II)
MIRTNPADWWRVRKLDDGITLIDEPKVHEFYRCNCWHVRGRDRDMLVDSGMGVVSLRDWVPLVTERALDAVASHTHFDHVGSHHEFPCRLCHAAEADLLTHPTRANTLADLYVTDAIFTELPPEPYTSATYGIRTAPPTRILHDADVIDLGDRHFEVIHTPGHSPGGIALWEAATGILFAGDVVYDGELIENAYHSNPADYYRSMVRLHDIPVRIVHAGHFASYDRTRHRQMIRDWLDAKDKS